VQRAQLAGRLEESGRLVLAALQIALDRDPRVERVCALEQLAGDLWHQDPVPLVKAVRVPVLVLAARQGDAGQDEPRRASVERARELLGQLLSVGWVAGGHELPLEHPDRVAGALAALAARVPHPA